MLNRKFDQKFDNNLNKIQEAHNGASFGASDAQSDLRPVQAAQTAGISYASPANSNTQYQPASPSVLLADGDNTLNAAFVRFADEGRDYQDIAMETHGCDLVTANLSAYLDGELDSAQTRLVGKHLGTCPQCGEIFEAMSNVDETVEREWRESTPLPSSLRFEQAVDDIMAALPSVPVEDVAFAARRVHARTRWMRFATGIAGIIAMLTSLWSSYWLGYANGRRSIAAAGSATINPAAFERNEANLWKHAATSPQMRSSITPNSLPVTARLTPASFLLPARSSTSLLRPLLTVAPAVPPALSARSRSASAYASLFTSSPVCP